MAGKKTDAQPETQAVPAVPKKTVIQKRADETEAEMIFRIRSGNGHSDEYEDRFNKPFPK